MNDSVTLFNLEIILNSSFLLLLCPGGDHWSLPSTCVMTPWPVPGLSLPNNWFPPPGHSRIVSDLNNSLHNYVASPPAFVFRGRVFLRSNSSADNRRESGDFNMIYTFENFSWSRLRTIHLSVQIIRHCFSQIWAEPIRNCISLMGQREKIQGELVNLKWSGQTRLHQSELSSILRHFWHLRKISFSKFEANQFWQTTNVCGKIRKIGVNFGRLLLALRGHFAASLVHNHPGLTHQPVSGGGGGCLEKLLVEFEIRDHSKPVSHIILP